MHIKKLVIKSHASESERIVPGASLPLTPTPTPPPPMLIENMTNLVGRENTFVLGYLIEITQSSVAQDLSGKWEVRVMKVRFLSSEIVAATLEVSLD